MNQEIRNRYLACMLMLMLAPYGIALPTLIEAAGAHAAPHSAQAQHTHVEQDFPRIYTGGTVMAYRSVWQVVEEDSAPGVYIRPIDL